MTQPHPDRGADLVLAARGDCPRIRSVTSRVGDKWSVLVIMLLWHGPRRFGAIKRGVEDVSQRMLTLTLRGLERDGFVTRTVTPTIPPRVDYELTTLGRSLAEPVQALGRWAVLHLDEIERARAGYDRRGEGEPAPPPVPGRRPATIPLDPIARSART